MPQDSSPPTYIWLTPETMLSDRSPLAYIVMYAEDWRLLLRKYGDEQMTLIYDWLFRRIQKLSFGQYIVIEKDAISLSSNLWLKGRYSQWNIPDDERILQFRWIAYLMIEWIWRNNMLARWQMECCDGETRLKIVQPPTDAILKLFSFFGHWPLAQPSISRFLTS